MSDAGGILGPGDGQDLLARMRGRAVGAIVCAGFGAYALYWWTEAAIEGERRLWFGAIALVTATLVVWGIASLVALRHAPRVALDKRLVALRYLLAGRSWATSIGQTSTGNGSVRSWGFTFSRSASYSKYLFTI